MKNLATLSLIFETHSFFTEMGPRYRITREYDEIDGEVVAGVPDIQRITEYGFKLSALDIPDWVLDELDRMFNEQIQREALSDRKSVV